MQARCSSCSSSFWLEWMHWVNNFGMAWLQLAWHNQSPRTALPGPAAAVGCGAGPAAGGLTSHARGGIGPTVTCKQGSSAGRAEKGHTDHASLQKAPLPSKLPQPQCNGVTEEDVTEGMRIRASFC
jgi:hypothetical protein